ncbi:hypothetical protein LOCC1_G003767 [Lachnellula occidentalis]|uniref:CENP-V/GFA domain-containing protein n=1 Tax=Lachnellula occidentalis TaxID=215460 RepID=A0A8H8S3C2_9HELO|nr:hypothetical protein LOCC1_G003767 [Lachnellula occidentalis]
MPSGGCWCDGTRYEYGVKPLERILCHCITCQKISGGAFTVNLMVPTSEVHMTKGADNLKCHTQPHILGGKLSVYFCGICGTCLYKQLHMTPFDQNFVIQSGTLDEVEGKLGADVEPPDQESFIECRASWLPAFELFDMRKLTRKVVAKD